MCIFVCPVGLGRTVTMEFRTVRSGSKFRVLSCNHVDPDEDDRSVKIPDLHLSQTIALATPPPALVPPDALASSTDTPFDHSISKALHHRRAHRNARRRANRARRQDPTMNRPMKSVASERPSSPIGPGASQTRSSNHPGPKEPALTDRPPADDPTPSSRKPTVPVGAPLRYCLLSRHGEDERRLHWVRRDAGAQRHQAQARGGCPGADGGRTAGSGLSVCRMGRQVRSTNLFVSSRHD